MIYFITFLNKADDTSTISYNYILPLLESSKKDIWVGTMGGGLNKYIESTNTRLHVHQLQQ